MMGIFILIFERNKCISGKRRNQVSPWWNIASGIVSTSYSYRENDKKVIEVYTPEVVSN